MPKSAPGLDLLARQTALDPGLKANTSKSDIAGGVKAARLMNEVIETAIRATGVNGDGLLDPADLARVSRYIRKDKALYETFVEGHGDDEGKVETGFHLVQGDGGTWKFQGRKFIDTVGDAIYHVGFAIKNGRFRNEDGDDNERVEDVAGWLNYYLNGENVVWGSNSGETLHSGDYSGPLKAARHERFEAKGGNDRIWAGDGNDLVLAGAGQDVSGGGSGNDRLYGGAGDDKLWGEAGNDRLDGGAGDDRLGGSTGRDSLDGGSGADHLSGDEGADRMEGGAGRDRLWAGTGNDLAFGGAGDDVIGGDTGNDRIEGGSGDEPSPPTETMGTLSIVAP